MIAVVVVLVVLGLLVLGCVRPPRVMVAVDGDVLRVRLGPLDRLMCARTDLAIPLAEVEGVAAEAAASVPRTGFRLPGTSLPGVVRAGSYGTGPKRDFWDVRRGSSYLVIQLRPGAVYRRIVLEVPDSSGEAARLRPLLGS